MDIVTAQLMQCKRSSDGPDGKADARQNRVPQERNNPSGFSLAASGSEGLALTGDSPGTRVSLLGCRSLGDCHGGLMEVPTAPSWATARHEISGAQLFILGLPTGNGRGLLSTRWGVEMLLSSVNTWAKLLREAHSDSEMMEGIHYEIMLAPADAQGQPRLWRPRQVHFSSGDAGPRVIGMAQDCAFDMHADTIWLSNYTQEIPHTDAKALSDLSDSDSSVPATPPTPPMRGGVMLWT